MSDTKDRLYRRNPPSSSGFSQKINKKAAKKDSLRDCPNKMCALQNYITIFSINPAAYPLLSGITLNRIPATAVTMIPATRASGTPCTPMIPNITPYTHLAVQLAADAY